MAVSALSRLSGRLIDVGFRIFPFGQHIDKLAIEVFDESLNFVTVNRCSH